MRAWGIRLFGVGTVFVAAVIGACSSDDDAAPQGACTPGQQVECACPGGTKGTQRCAADGTGFETCRCQGAGVDGGGENDGSNPNDAANDQASEPTGPVALGVIPADNGSIVGMVIDTDTVFVAITKPNASPTDGKVFSIPITGGQPKTIATGPIRSATFQTGSMLAASPTHVFYVAIAANNEVDIMKQSRDGQGTPAKFITAQPSVSILAYSDNFIYWRKGDALRRSPTGTAGETGVIDPVSADFWVFGGHVFYESANTLSKVAVGGGAGAPIVADKKVAALSLTGDPFGTTLVYHDYSPNSSVYTAPTAGAADGKLVTTAPNDGTETPRIATDGVKVYYVSNFALKAVSIGGGTSVDLVTTHKPMWVTNYGKHVYWYNRNDTTVWRMLKP